ncbi:hypothetical protein ACRRTK_021095 [Alexandromys fortis]
MNKTEENKKCAYVYIKTDSSNHGSQCETKIGTCSEPGFLPMKVFPSAVCSVVPFGWWY